MNMRREKRPGRREGCEAARAKCARDPARGRVAAPPPHGLFVSRVRLHRREDGNCADEKGLRRAGDDGQQA